MTAVKIGRQTLAAYTYTYDSSGNITEIYDGVGNNRTLLAKYTYDEANQLIREDNAELAFSRTYTYDVGGNIVQKKTYAYTTGTLGTVLDTVNYTYDASGKTE